MKLYSSQVFNSTSHFDPAGICTCVTETDKAKRQHLDKISELVQGPGIAILDSNAAFNAEPLLDTQKKRISKPFATIAYLGIPCIDISNLPSSPKTLEDPRGKSGKAYLDFKLALARHAPFHHGAICVGTLKKMRVGMFEPHPRALICAST